MSGALVQVGPFAPGWNPALFHVFPDCGSLCHVFLGAIAASLPGNWSLVAASLFAGYEVSKSASNENWSRIGGTWIEFAIGAAAVLVVKELAK